MAGSSSDNLVRESQFNPFCGPGMSQAMKHYADPLAFFINITFIIPIITFPIITNATANTLPNISAKNTSIGVMILNIGINDAKTGASTSNSGRNASNIGTNI